MLRNPAYVGRFQFGKVIAEFDPKTGKHKKRKRPKHEIVEIEMPWLRIVPDDLFERNQERIQERSFEMPHRNRRPDYLLTWKVRCGVCGAPYAMVTSKMGCTARRLKACINKHAASIWIRLERVVLDGLPDRLCTPELLACAWTRTGKKSEMRAARLRPGNGGSKSSWPKPSVRSRI